MAAPELTAFDTSIARTVDFLAASGTIPDTPEARDNATDAFTRTIEYAQATMTHNAA